VRGLAELHGGRAWIESDFGKGCRAYVILPVAQVRAGATRKQDRGVVAV
jgi:signal transduction histidine kinase